MKKLILTKKRKKKNKRRNKNPAGISSILLIYQTEFQAKKSESNQSTV
jgi:hypothetical protein